MAQCEEGEGRKMSIFHPSLTRQWAILVKSLRDG
jgi:hypothetical protein